MLNVDAPGEGGDMVEAEGGGGVPVGGGAGVGPSEAPGVEAGGGVADFRTLAQH